MGRDAAGRARRGAACAAAVAVGALAALAPAAGAATRGIELVSPAGSDPYDVHYAAMTPDGGSVLLSSKGTFAGATPDGASAYEDDLYWSRRGSNGWDVSWALPGSDIPTWTQPLAVADGGNAYVMATPQPLSPDDVDDLGTDLYLYDDGAYTLLSGGPGDVPGNTDSIEEPAWVSPGLDRAVFTTPSALLPADQSPGRDVYEWVKGSGLRLVSVDDAGDTGTSGDARFGEGMFTRNAVSADGRTIVFSTTRSLDPSDGDTSRDTYARIGGTSTVLVSAAGGDLATFVGAAADGTMACFETAAQLEPSDVNGDVDVYCRSLAGGTPGALTRVSTSTGVPERASGDASPLGVSDDGSHVFFVSSQQLTPDGPSGSPAIYVHHDGMTELVAPLVASDLSPLNGELLGQEATRPFRMTADGRTAVFVTASQDAAGDADNAKDVYRWQDGTLTLVSRPPAGAPVTDAPAVLPTGFNGNFQFAPQRTMSPDGRQVFFETTESLDPADTDGGAVDVYEDDAGAIALVSPAGGDPADVHDAGSSPDGVDVYLTTTAGLLPQDTDMGQLDVYDARVGGGFPQPPPSAGSPGGSGGGGGGGPVAGPPPAPAPASASPKPAEPTPPARDDGSSGGTGPKPALRVTVTGRRGRALRVRLRAPHAGALDVRATGRLGHRARRATVAHAKRSVRAGRVALTVRVSARARAVLRRVHRLRMTVRVRYTPAGGHPLTRRLTLTLHSPSKR